MATSTSTLCCTYLIEELIDEQKDGFYKFINNGSAVPLPSMNESVLAFTEFLSFAQHVQCHKTKALIYLSDLQGTLKLLTDPQIMTVSSKYYNMREPKPEPEAEQPVPVAAGRHQGGARRRGGARGGAVVLDSDENPAGGDIVPEPRRGGRHGVAVPTRIEEPPVQKRGTRGGKRR
ncbi:hypothetical protein C8F04DRAFT_1267360 [Mycena alexandri]|uniref:Alpha-type protein kinase domain-containing protein n=1 Tax=Mycena alexandri TaxID=1745969 RepID=A0AAD6WZU2_9AGAR|nr:hypothetical protein C8F04DRAFT_1267360 [Mycena alexandri]